MGNACGIPETDMSEDPPNELICVVCYELMIGKHRPMALSCGHVMCEECLNRLEKESCPVCKKEIILSTHVPIITSIIDEYLEKRNPKRRECEKRNPRSESETRSVIERLRPPPQDQHSLSDLQESRTLCARPIEIDTITPDAGTADDRGQLDWEAYANDPTDVRYYLIVPA
jgi:hypothetical protein